MNDRFKFRAWDGENMREIAMIEFDDTGRDELIKVWDHPSTRTAKIKFAISTWKKKNCKIMQSTGLKDRNGVLIFEGDILLGRGVVVWVDDDYESEFVGWHIRDIEEDKYGKHRLISFYGSTLEPEIIGNCHENPELLKQQPQ